MRDARDVRRRGERKYLATLDKKRRLEDSCADPIDREIDFCVPVIPGYSGIYGARPGSFPVSRATNVMTHSTHAARKEDT